MQKVLCAYHILRYFYYYFNKISLGIFAEKSETIYSFDVSWKILPKFSLSFFFQLNITKTPKNKNKNHLGCRYQVSTPTINLTTSVFCFFFPPNKHKGFKKQKNDAKGRGPTGSIPIINRHVGPTPCLPRIIWFCNLIEHLHISDWTDFSRAHSSYFIKKNIEWLESSIQVPKQAPRVNRFTVAM